VFVVFLLADITLHQSLGSPPDSAATTSAAIKIEVEAEVETLPDQYNLRVVGHCIEGSAEIAEAPPDLEARRGRERQLSKKTKS